MRFESGSPLKKPEALSPLESKEGLPGETRPVQGELGDVLNRKLAMAKMADSAEVSLRRVEFENQLSGMTHHLESLNGNDWAEFRSLVGTLDMTDEEAQAVDEVITMLQAMRPEFSEERRKASLQSFARRSKIIDVAIASKTFDRLPRETTQGRVDGIRSATTSLMEALSHLSSEQDVKESVERRGLIISRDEVQEAVERGKRLNIV